MIGAVLVFCSRLHSFLQVRVWRYLVPARLRAIGVELEKDVAFTGWPLVQMDRSSRIRIGSRAALCSDSRFTALGVCKPIILKTLRPGAVISIGDDTGMSGTVICAALSVSIGKSCLIGADVTISDTDFHAVEPQNRRYRWGWDGIGVAEVVIGDNVFVGAGVRILKGAKIGANSVIGAGSIVIGEIPANTIAAGVPCRPIGKVTGAPTSKPGLNDDLHNGSL